MYGMNNMVSWKDYDGVEGFGSMTQEAVDELNKALTAGQAINAPAFVPGEGFALRVESLEKTLKSTTFRMEHVRAWKAVPKIPAFNTVEEHNVISSFGVNPDAGFISEGDLPEGDDATYNRMYAVVKFMGTTRRITHPMTLIRPAHGNVLSMETVNGTMHLLRMMERALFYGDHNLSALQFDGWERMLLDNAPAANIIDLRGQPLSEDILTDGALTIQDAPNYGTPTHLFLNPKPKADLCKTFFPKERHDTFVGSKGGLVGLDIKGFTSPAGDVMFEPDVFITDGGLAPTAAVGDATKIPATPVTAQVGGDWTPVDATAQFTADDVGAYYLKVCACNRYGKSVSVDVAAGPATITPAAGDNITFGVTPGSAVAVEWYEVYRCLKGGAVTACRQVLRIANSAGAGQMTIHERNDRIPFCTSAYLFQFNLEALSFKQLAPLVKIPLATLDSSIRFMMLLYGVPVMYAFGKHVLYKNVGRASGYVGQP